MQKISLKERTIDNLCENLILIDKYFYKTLDENMKRNNLLVGTCTDKFVFNINRKDTKK